MTQGFTEAQQICADSDIIDLHLDTWIPKRLWGYHPFKRHQRALFGRHFFGHADIPRLQDAGVTGAMWSITTNPFKLNNARWLTFLENLRQLEHFCATHEDVQLCRNFDDYQSAKAHNRHAVFPSVQGANAISGAPNGVSSLPENHGILRMTLVHLTPSVYGNTSSPGHLLHTHKGLTPAGQTLVEEMNHHKIMVDLAHIHPNGFWDAVDAHDPTRPILVTHTGVQGIMPHWRNLDDTQIRAIADSGGVVGIMFATNFLAHSGKRDASIVLDHLEHLIQIGGEDIAAIGTDYDGAISAPTDLPSIADLPTLVQGMLTRNWSLERIQKILGFNFLRVLKSW
jgi:membrane dipeptidase